jgi:hypothetical protein
MAPRSVRFGVRSRRLSNVGQSLDKWPKNLISWAPPCFGRHVKPLVSAAFAVVTPTNSHWARVVGYSPFSLCVIHKEGLYPSSGDINRLMMIALITNCKCILWRTVDRTYACPTNYSHSVDSGEVGLRPKLIAYLQSLIEVNPKSMSIHISIFCLRPYYKSQLAIWIHYWHTQTQIWIEIAMTDG